MMYCYGYSLLPRLHGHILFKSVFRLSVFLTDIFGAFVFVVVVVGGGGVVSA